MKIKGFSVIELLVVSSIFIIIFAISLVNYNQAQKTETLRVMADKLASDISWVQTAALAGLSEGEAVNYSYGIYLKYGGNGYDLYRDDNGNKAYNVGVDKLMRTESMGTEFELGQMQVNAVTSDVVDVIFVPPRPTVYANGLVNAPVSIIVNRSKKTEKSVKLQIDPVTGRVRQDFIINN